VPVHRKVIYQAIVTVKSIHMLTKSQRLVFIFGAWVILTLAGLSLLGSLDVIYFFILCLIGFLIIFDLSGPYTVKPLWKLRVRNITVLGILVFIIIAATKLVEVVGPRYL
jgi:hypothetical protein